MILATRGLEAVPFIRVPVIELWLAKRALDQGALGIIFRLLRPRNWRAALSPPANILPMGNEASGRAWQPSDGRPRRAIPHLRTAT